MSKHRTLEAVTAVFTVSGDTDEQLFMVKRQPYLAAFPGYNAFPGGKIEPSDSTPTAEKRPYPPFTTEINEVHYNALERELQEELGFSLREALLNGDVADISLLGNATAPTFAPLRVDTWFYRIRLKRPTAFDVDEAEASEGEWHSLNHWLAGYRGGELLMAPPTRAVIEELSERPSAESLKTLQFHYNEAHDVPLIEPIAGLRVLPVRSNTLPPAQHTNCFVLGDEPNKRIVVDPSPADNAELEKLMHTLRPLEPAAVFITHHHGDHNERADELARSLNLPLRMSRYTEQRLRQNKPDFFRDVTIELVNDGDIQCVWQGKKVRAIAVPGHDEGQLALAPVGENPAWCVVGDLIQGIGSVVIAPPEGNMAKYFHTMQSVIDLNPAVILPSHGMAMGSTFRLTATLDHRRQREASILACRERGDTEDEMLHHLYSDIPEVLLPLARINIQSHATKLQQEGRW